MRGPGAAVSDRGVQTGLLQNPEVLTYFFLDLGQEVGPDGGGG